MNGVTKDEGVATLASAINAADEWIVMESTPGHPAGEGGWVAFVRLGRLVIQANNVVIDASASETTEGASEYIRRNVNTTVAAGLFTKDRGTVEVGVADPTDVADMRREIDAERRNMERQRDVMRQIMEQVTADPRMAAVAERLGVALPQGAAPVAAGSASEDDWRPGMYV